MTKLVHGEKARSLKSEGAFALLLVMSQGLSAWQRRLAPVTRDVLRVLLRGLVAGLTHLPSSPALALLDSRGLITRSCALA